MSGSFFVEAEELKGFLHLLGSHLQMDMLESLHGWKCGAKSQKTSVIKKSIGRKFNLSGGKLSPSEYLHTFILVLVRTTLNIKKREVSQKKHFELKVSFPYRL